MQSVESLFDELRLLDEHPRIEAKRAGQVGSSIMQTLCAFANEPGLGGGYLLLGVCEPDELHDKFWLDGVTDIDKLLNDTQVNCREQFEAPIPVQCEAVVLEGKRIIAVYVPELDAAAKPCVFKGKFDSKNKRKTGVWRRGLNGDYECSQQELEPLLLAKSGLSFEQVVLPDAEWEDLDSGTISLYRQLRARVRPQAEELLANDEEMLRALNLVKETNGRLRPNVAGLLLLGKSLALRRLLPAVRVDYVRIQGVQWVQDPTQRFATTLDFREPLIRLIARLEATILDAVDNAALRDISGLDTLAASQVLRRLHHDRGLLVKGGGGPSTYYQLAELPAPPSFDARQTTSIVTTDATKVPNTSDLAPNTSDLIPNTSDLTPNTSEFPPTLLVAIKTLSSKARKEKLWPLILWLCSIRPHSAEQLARQLHRQMGPLKTGHINPLRDKEGFLEYLHPEVVNHPQQAYRTTEAGRLWLAEQGISPIPSPRQ
ncbi:RNA-binding domain-containing protein [Pseudomonas sp. MWU12-2345]|uniref:AlbA family DNA-binding domain-containing protein n=1 Tax=Pseudomonas sp. MWU12-2345 TaxID=2928689 RepID=UPI0020105B42|nr:RNA-binding domain-containing protein [Pseudomonas sp. MWU12-2345]